MGRRNTHAWDTFLCCRFSGLLRFCDPSLQVYSWVARAWEECDAPCGGGTRQRLVECVDSSTWKMVDHANCQSAAPAREEACNTQLCDFCANQRCSGHGTCADGACRCADGYRGLFCGTAPECDGVMTASGICCDGILDFEGGCCAGANPWLDGRAECCPSGLVDVCGVCDGGAVSVDVAGRCCASVLDGQGLCCDSGAVDECGVCDGDGTSCSKQVRDEGASSRKQCKDTV